jgi:hypothetical protein
VPWLVLEWDRWVPLSEYQLASPWAIQLVIQLAMQLAIQLAMQLVIQLAMQLANR